jgi:hypothetical protein
LFVVLFISAKGAESRLVVCPILLIYQEDDKAKEAVGLAFWFARRLIQAWSDLPNLCRLWQAQGIRGYCDLSNLDSWRLGQAVLQFYGAEATHCMATTAAVKEGGVYYKGAYCGCLGRWQGCRQQ